MNEFRSHLHVVQLDVPADPLELGRRVWQRGAVLLWSADGSGPSFVACSPQASVDTLDPEPELHWGGSDEQWGWVPRWCGVLSYEAQRSRLERPEWAVEERRSAPLFDGCTWYRFGAVAVITEQVHVVGDDAHAVHRLCQQLTVSAAAGAAVLRVDGEPVGVPGELDAARHRAMVQQALELIGEGDVYQINLARRLDFRVSGDTLALLERMSESVAAPYAAAFELDQVGVASTSPELFLQTDQRRQMLTVPIKGTRPRTNEPATDQATERDLERDVKERAELAMVVDVERNDLGRVAVLGSVIAETPRVLPYSTVFHRVARVRAVARPEVTRQHVLESLLPSGSVTGAPKVRAMELIARLEEHRRGLYTGALGYVAHDGTMNLSMAIRCLVRRGAVAHYHVGGGIVVRSDPARELEETIWKAQQVLRAVAR